MNCIILLLLLGCCGGWGNDGCGRMTNRGNCCGREACCNKMPDRRDRDCDRREPCGRDCDRDCDREDSCRGDRDRDCDRGDSCRGDRGRDCDRRESCGRERENRQDDCCCEERSACGCAQDERESCDVPGMIPPPWQEYPRFPRRDRGEDCEG